MRSTKETFAGLTPILTYLEADGARFQTLADHWESRFAALSTQGEQAVNEASKALQVAQDTAALTGVARHSKLFATQASEHQVRGRSWLIATIVLAFVTAGMAIWVATMKFPGKVDLGQTIQWAVTRLAGFSLCYYAMIWAGRVYRSELHNYVVNRHRQNSLNTFEAFVEGATDETTKNAILLQASAAVFAPQSTGYAQQDAEPSAPQLVGVLQSALEPKKP